MKHLLFALALLPSLAFGTGQNGERLVYKGSEVEMFGFPLESYFEQNPPRPEWLTEINTACHRGYVGSWEISGGELYLKSVSRAKWSEANSDPVEKEIFGKLFPKATSPLRADWFTGVISIPRGKILRYEGFTEIREKEELLTFKEGRLVNTRELDRRPRAPSHIKGKGVR